jgi:hypothetical protein
MIDSNSAPRMAEYGKANGGLARTRLAHETEHTAWLNRQGHLIDDVQTACLDIETQVLDS